MIKSSPFQSGGFRHCYGEVPSPFLFLFFAEPAQCSCSLGVTCQQAEQAPDLEGAILPSTVVVPLVAACEQTGAASIWAWGIVGLSWALLPSWGNTHPLAFWPGGPGSRRCHGGKE